MEVLGFKADERVPCPEDALASAIRFGSLAGAQRVWARHEPGSFDSLWRAAEKYRGGEQAALAEWLAKGAQLSPSKSRSPDAIGRLSQRQ
jgi:hypothetical protein